MNFRTIILFAFTLAWAAGCSAPAEEKVKSAKELMQRVPESNIQVPAATDQCIRGRATCEALGLKIRREFAPGYAGLTWMYECVAAAQSGDFASLQSWIHPDHGFFLIHKPGAAPTFQHFVAATDLAGSAWENFAVKGRKPRNLTQEDIFMTAPYRITPEWSKDAAHIIPPITCRTEGNFI
ncbi:MAG TPA: hypothetical protein ENJ82_16160, partial [Bacteroidetes bacterium]|nr:hypothetical protein [Bacteroidota bacterium]